MSFDFEILDRVEVESREELADALRDGTGPVRLCGYGTGQDRVPAPTDPVRLVDVSRLRRIERLEPGDLTCSVQPGLRRSELDAALAEHRLWLPCAGTGSIGGLFARDEHGPLAPDALGPRNLLLGFEGVLTDGRAFKAGASVVKSVAGFDLNKLFVGSVGRLFAVTLLHLKLRPAPRATRSFAVETEDLATGVDRLHRLRTDASAPCALTLRRPAAATTWCVEGTLTGHERVVDREAELLELGPPRDGEPIVDPPLGDGELVVLHARPSRLAALLAGVPDDADVIATGTGRVALAVPSQAASDAALAAAAELGARGTIRRGAPTRRGVGTAGDPAAARLATELRAALDPRGMLQ